MASGDTLAVFTPFDNEPPASTFATLAVVATSLHPILQFVDAVQGEARFTSIMPQNYSNATGITIILWWSCTVTTGNVAWLISFERMDTGTDLDTDNFATGQGSGTTAPSGTIGAPIGQSFNIAKGSTTTDSIVAGDVFRLKVIRDAATDTSTGTVQLLAVELRET